MIKNLLISGMICQKTCRGFSGLKQRNFLLLRWKSTTSSAKSIRNIGIIAHIDAGKTTTTERMLYYAGYTRQIGDVDQGNTVTDFLPQERARGITIQSACIPLGWKNHLINLIDTPGHVDFTMEVERAIRVLDGCVCILDGVAGVEAQTETVWQQANGQALPRLILVNKLDRIGASFDRCVKSIQERLKGWGDGCIVQVPLVDEKLVGTGGEAWNGFLGIIDLITMELLDWRLDSKTGSQVRRTSLVELFGEGMEWREIVGGFKDVPTIDEESLKSILEHRARLIEQLTLLDEGLLEEFLESNDELGLKLSLSKIKEILRRETLKGSLVPILCAASFRHVGVQPLMDAVIDYLPSPLDRPPMDAVEVKSGKHVQISSDFPNMMSLAFKVINDQKRGPLTFVRVYSGVLERGLPLLSMSDSEPATERPLKILQPYADDYEDVAQLTVGQIGAVSGLKTTKTGDTLCDRGLKSSPIALKGVNIPPPVFFVAIEPANSSEDAKLLDALKMMEREDPSLRWRMDEESGQIVALGMGELHLEIIADRLKNPPYQVRCEIGKVRVGYREQPLMDVGEEISQSTILDQDVLGKTLQCNVQMRMSIAPDSLPKTDDKVVAIKDEEGNCIVVQRQVFRLIDGEDFKIPALRHGHQTLPTNYPHYQQLFAGLKSACEIAIMRGGEKINAPLHGTILHVDSCDLISPETSTESAIRNAVLQCVQSMLKQVGTRILEPVASCEVSVPAQYVGNVTRDLSSQRRAIIESVSQDGDVDARHLVFATVPVAEMAGYSNALRSVTAGNGTFGYQVKGYSPVHGDGIEEGIIKEVRGY